MAETGWFKTIVMKMLKIQPAQERQIIIKEPLSFSGTVMRNRIWYRGDASELEQFFKGCIMGRDDTLSKARFWAAVPSQEYIRKFHSGLPAIIVDRLADIVVSDLDRITVNNFDSGEGDTELWEQIAEDNAFIDKLRGAVVDTLVAGDGAFKVTIDTDISQYPIIEFFSGDDVDYVKSRGRLKEIHFYTTYERNRNEYRLKEIYGKSYMRYELLDKYGNKVSLATLPETADLMDATYDGDFFLAVPMQFFKSPKFEGRGRSVYEVKTDCFDALDETVSQWIDAVRAGRVSKYMPEVVLPVNEENGSKMLPNPFDNNFIKVQGDMAEGADNKVDVVQPDINYEAFVNTYSGILDICLQGIISPATLGIDLKKTDNSEAQREKEKITMYTRGKIVDTLSEVVPLLIEAVMNADDLLHNRPKKEYEANIEFGEYGTPTFEQTVDTVGKASQQGTMSVETQVDQLWGDRKDEDWKKEEVARIKNEKGIVELEEPAVNMELGEFKVKEEPEDGGSGSKSKISDEPGGIPGAS